MLSCHCIYYSYIHVIRACKRTEDIPTLKYSPMSTSACVWCHVDVVVWKTVPTLWLPELYIQIHNSHTQSTHTLYCFGFFCVYISVYFIHRYFEEKRLPDGCFFSCQFTHFHTCRYKGIQTEKYMWSDTTCRTCQTCTHTCKHTHHLTLFPLALKFLLTQTINFALAGFYPSSWGHNYFKYAIALCDISSFLMNISPSSPLAA